MKMILSAGLILVASISVQAEQTEHTEHAAHAHPLHSATVAEPAAAGQRWMADAPLREGMARIGKERQALGPLEHGHLAAKHVTVHAEAIRAAVNFMFANCRLDPEPDSALHPLLAQLIGASQALLELPSDPAPLAEVDAALARYKQLFDEPDSASADE